MEIKIENNIATLEPNTCRPDGKLDNYEVKFIIKRLDGKEITARDAEIVLTSAIQFIPVQRTGELTE
jgi:hypothetical protein